MKPIISIVLMMSFLSISSLGISATSKDEHDHQKENQLIVDDGHEHTDAGHADEEHDEHKGHDEHEGHEDHANETKGHDDHGEQSREGHSEHEEGGVSLTQEKLKLADISVTRLEQKTLTQEIIVPGEVKANRYETSILSPRINAQVVKRHVRLGQSVKKGQPMVSLSSVDMAAAQGELIITNREWLRVKKLGRKVVSEKRYIAAQIAQQQAQAKVVAYGMTKNQVSRLLDKGDIVGATGQFELLAPQNGTVIQDAFIVGEIVEPGRVLFEITNEARLWVEARARPELASEIANNAKAKINFQNTWFEGKVIQVQHVIDEETRTLPVRLEVTDRQHKLHPGQFVEVRLQLTSTSAVMAIPKAAALRNSEGEWVVFVEKESGRYDSIDITPIRTAGDQLIVDGLTAGMQVVVKGAFFLQSEMAKSGFDVHNH